MLRESIGIEPSTPPTTKISVRLPNGSRIIRSFLPTDSLLVLYDFVEAQDLAPLDLEAEFNIYNTFPRKVADARLSFKEAGLVPNASVIVEEKID